MVTIKQHGANSTSNCSNDNNMLLIVASFMEPKIGKPLRGHVKIYGKSWMAQGSQHWILDLLTRAHVIWEFPKLRSLFRCPESKVRSPQIVRNRNNALDCGVKKISFFRNSHLGRHAAHTMEVHSRAEELAVLENKLNSKLSWFRVHCLIRNVGV